MSMMDSWKRDISRMHEERRALEKRRGRSPADEAAYQDFLKKLEKEEADYHVMRERTGQ